MKFITCTAVKRWNSEILAAKNTTETSSWKKDLEKIQAHTGFEPVTSAIPVQRSTNWANKPAGNCSICWVQIGRFIWTQNIYLFCRKPQVCGYPSAELDGYQSFWISPWLKLSHKLTYSFCADFAARPILIVLGNFWATCGVWSNFLRF